MQDSSLVWVACLALSVCGEPRVFGFGREFCIITKIWSRALSASYDPRGRLLAPGSERPEPMQHARSHGVLGSTMGRGRPLYGLQSQSRAAARHAVPGSGVDGADGAIRAK